MTRLYSLRVDDLCWLQPSWVSSCACDPLSFAFPLSCAASFTAVLSFLPRGRSTWHVFSICFLLSRSLRVEVYKQRKTRPRNQPIAMDR